MMPANFGTRLRAAATTVLGLLLLIACDAQPEKKAGESEAQPSPPPATSSPTIEKTWQDIPVARPEDRITIHYHRRDNSYAGMELWTWDAYEKSTPGQNEVLPLGQDKFGLVFQVDRANYAGSDKIGLIPRLGHDWSHKDGGDRIWTPTLGNEVWLLSANDELFVTEPDLSPHIEAAWIDAPTAIVLRLTDPVPAVARISILDQEDATHVADWTPAEEASGQRTQQTTAGPASQIVVTPQDPLDPLHEHYRVRVEGFGPAVALTPRRILDDPELYFDGAAQLGANYTPQATTFRIFAPTATAINLALYDEATGANGRTVLALTPQAKGVWALTQAGDLAGKFYTYLLAGPSLDPEYEVVDPYAINTVASSTRARIAAVPAASHLGGRSEAPTDRVIYEMDVRDFTIDLNSGVHNRGLFLGFTEPNTRLVDDAAIQTALDHLAALGVTDVELLPVQDYANDEAHPAYDWGYNPVAYFSPEGEYATNPADGSRLREYKTLIDALHARGLGVIMDVVYNHTAATAPFQHVAPGYYYRHLPDGAMSNGAACGNEFRTEAPMARKLMLDSLTFWARAYGVDGYRFDLMALLDQETMQEAERQLHAINPGIVLYGEPWKAGPTPLQDGTDKTALHQVPVGAFNDDFRNALKGSPDGRDPGFIQNGSNREALKKSLLLNAWFASCDQSINYMTCHDNLVLWDKLKASMPKADDRLLIETMKLGYLVLFTAEGVPFFQGGEEFARTKGGNNNSYNAPDSVNQVDWSLKQKHFDLFTYTRDAIALRKAHPVFRLRTRTEVAARLRFEETASPATLMYTLDAAGLPGETWARACVILNSDNRANAEIALPPGQWLVALDEQGASAERAVSARVNVRAKSGLVLYQK